MPFHINYTGPAPISTYFVTTAAESTLPLPAPAPVPVPSSQDVDATGVESKADAEHMAPDVEAVALSLSDSQATEASEFSQATEATTLDASNASLQDTLVPSDSFLAPIKSTDMMSTFRGRQVIGRSIDLPQGYVGLVLQTDKTATDGDQEHGRNRRGKNAMDIDEHDDAAPSAGPTRKIVPTATFSSFMVWSPDIPVDEGRDEYIRSLKEWTALAEVVCQSFVSSCCALTQCA